MAFKDRPGKKNFKLLQEFLDANDGVEGYFEPQTPTMQQSLLLVARDGQWQRIPIQDRKRAASICNKSGIPLYDAAVVGYPKRMKSPGKTSAPPAPSAEELDKWFSEEKDADSDE